MRLTTHLTRLADDVVTGRLDLLGAHAGRVYVADGRVTCAEQHGHQTMLLAMAEAGLFAPTEWAAALRAPLAERWTTLVGGDPDRLQGLIAFAHDYTARQLRSLAGNPIGDVLLHVGATHPLGTLASWPAGDFLPPEAPVLAIDRSEFLELLAEISPHVRR